MGHYRRLPDGLQEQTRKFLKAKDNRGHYFVIDSLTDLALSLEALPKEKLSLLTDNESDASLLTLTRSIAALGKLMVQGTEFQYAPNLTGISINYYITDLGKNLKKIRDLFDKAARHERDFPPEDERMNLKERFESISEQIGTLQQAFNATIGTVLQRKRH